MTIQPPMKHAKSLLFFRKSDGHGDYLLTKEEKQEELEGKRKIKRVAVWIHPQDTSLKTTPTKVPIDYTSNGVTETVGKELYDINQVKFIHNINI
jgi:hypothetical protein